MASSKKVNPPQAQPRQPGRQKQMVPEPETMRVSYRGSGKLEGRVALITGGDSGIGRAVAVHFAAEGADVAIAYLEEDASYDAGKVSTFGSETLLGRAGQPSEVAPAYVFLASDDASYVTGQLLHVNGGSHMSA